MSHDSAVTTRPPVTTWHAGPQGLTIWRDGVPVATIPAARLARLAADLTAVVADRQEDAR